MLKLTHTRGAPQSKAYELTEGEGLKISPIQRAKLWRATPVNPQSLPQSLPQLLATLKEFEQRDEFLRWRSGMNERVALGDTLTCFITLPLATHLQLIIQALIPSCALPPSMSHSPYTPLLLPSATLRKSKTPNRVTSRQTRHD